MPECDFMHSFHTMQPAVRQFPLEGKGHMAPTSSQVDPLLQFDPEDRNVSRRDESSISSPTSVSEFLSEAVAPPAKVEVRPSTPSKVDRASWRVVAGAMCGGVLVAVVHVLMQFASDMTGHNVLTPVSQAATPVPAAASVEVSRAATASVAPAGDKKPVARVSSKPRSPAVAAPVTPPSTANRPIAPARFYGSLAIDSVPASARAFINGEAAGITPLVLTEVPVGSRAIRLEADDHTSWSSTVRVVAGQQTRVSATLIPSK